MMNRCFAEYRVALSGVARDDSLRQAGPDLTRQISTLPWSAAASRTVETSLPGCFAVVDSVSRASGFASAVGEGSNLHQLVHKVARNSPRARV